MDLLACQIYLWGWIYNVHFPTLEPKAKKRLYFDSHDQKDLKMEENGDLEGAHDDDDND